MTRGNRACGPQVDASPSQGTRAPKPVGHFAAPDAELLAYGLVQQEKANGFDAYKLNERTLATTFYKDPKKADTYFKAVNGKARAKKGNGHGTPAEAGK